MRFVVTLVHGTWAAQAKWIDRDAPLPRHLCKHLADAGHSLRVEPFRWSGGNSVGARYAAANALKGHLLELATADPEARHFVVGHSHGGSVAMYATGDPAVAATLSGVACLATPFLHVAKRPTAFVANTFMALLVGISAALTVLLIIAAEVFAQWLWTAWRGHSGTVPVLVFIGPGILGGAAVGARKLLVRVSQQLEVRAARCIDASRLPPPGLVPTLLVRASGDEASGPLGAAAVLVGYTSLWWMRVGRYAEVRSRRYSQAPEASVTKKSVRSRLRTTLLFLASLAAASAIAVRAGVPEAVLVALVVVAVLLGVYVRAELTGWLPPVLIRSLLVILTVLLIPIWGMALIPFGWEVAAVSPWLDVSAEATPPGKWDLLHVTRVDRWYDDDPSRALALRHSSLYDDPNVHEAVGHWMQRVHAETVMSESPTSSASERREVLTLSAVQR